MFGTLNPMCPVNIVGYKFIFLMLQVTQIRIQIPINIKQDTDPDEKKNTSTLPITRVSDPGSIRSVDPDPYSESRLGYRRAKITHKRTVKKCHVLKCLMFSVES